MSRGDAMRGPEPGQPDASSAIGRAVFAGWAHVATAAVALPVQTGLIVRHLSPELAGFWLVLIGFATYATLLDAGLGPTLSRSIALHTGAPARCGTTTTQRASDRLAAATPGDLWATTGPLYMVLLLALAACVLLLGPVLVPALLHSPYGGSARDAWLAFGVGLGVHLLGSRAYAALAGLGHVGYNRMGAAVAQLAGLVGLAAAVLSGGGIRGVAAAWLLQNAVNCAAAWLLLHRLGASRRMGGGAASAALAVAMIGPSLRWAGINLGAALILAGGPALISMFHGPQAVAPYAVLLQLVTALIGIALIPAQAAEPFFSRAWAAGDGAAVGQLLTRTVRRTLAAVASGGAALAVFGADLVRTWVGPGQYAGDAVLWVLVAVAILEAHHIVHAMLVMATGRVVFLPASLLAAALTLALAAVLVPAWGPLGMAVSVAVAQLGTNNWYAPWRALRLIGLSWGRYAAAALAPLGWLVALSAGAAFTARAALAAVGGGLPGLLGALVLTGLAALPAAWYVVLSAEERFAVRGRALLVMRGRRHG